MHNICYLMHYPEEKRKQLLRKSGHDMKSLLCGLCGFSALLLRRKEAEGADEKELKILREMVEAGNKLSALVGDLHDFLKLEQAERLLTQQVTEVSPLLDEVSSAVQGWLLAKKLQFETECSSESLSVSADASLLSEVLTHLVVFATRFADATSCIRLSCTKETETKKSVFCLHYHSSLLPEDLPSCFEAPRWYASEKGAPLQSGIALPLCKAVADACGWELSFIPSGGFSLSVPSFSRKGV